jgi:hypothetical protein
VLAGKCQVGAGVGFGVLGEFGRSASKPPPVQACSRRFPKEKRSGGRYAPASAGAAPTPGRRRLTLVPAGEAARVRPFASFRPTPRNAEVVGDDGQVNPVYVL